MYILGIDIGGTKCASVLAAVTEKSVDFIKRTEIRTEGTPTEILSKLSENARRDAIDAKIGLREIKAVGISCGGPLDAKNGLVLSPPNLPCWDAVPVAEYFEKQFGAPARLMNDADACAVAEWKYGAGKGLSHVIFLTFGTGMGAGLILNNALYEGASSNAGEIGHVRICADGPVGYGKRGSFEGYCSGGGIARLAKSVREERMQVGSSVSFGELVTAKDLAEAAKKGDKDALEIYREVGERLGSGLSVLVDVLNPEMIILGGVFMRSSELLTESMMDVMRRECLPFSLEKVRIVPSKLGERIGDYGSVVAGLQALEDKINNK